MDNNYLLTSLAGIILSAGPIVVATVGETITERAGVINLSINGTIILAAMAGFAVSVETHSLILGLLAGAAVGALVALILAFSSITLKQSQVAVGFVLALTCRDLAYFLGNPYMGVSGPRINATPIPLLSNIPILGPLFFRQDIMTYFSILLFIAAFIFIFKTKAGLMLQGLGEKPAAVFVRGANVNRLRYFYTLLGGALVGLAGPMYSLNVKAGWNGTITGLDGYGWIVLSLTIFGAWDPIRASLGAYLFSFLQWLGVSLQPYLSNVPTQVLQVAPFPLMILTLLLVNVGNAEWVDRTLAGMPEDTRRIVAKILRAMRTTPPESLGAPFENE